MSQPSPTDLSTPMERDGFTIVPDVLPEQSLVRYRSLIEHARKQDRTENVSNSSDTYGLRNLTDAVPEITDILTEPKLIDTVTEVLGPKAFMVRATLFDKTPNANWGVFWHQDLSIAVEERHEVDGFSAWTRKAGVHSVQPPIELMQQILAVRLHLDDSKQTNGALKVLPGTHNLGRMENAAVDSQRGKQQEVICEANAGDALLMRPTLLHASSPMDEPTSRRVLHFEFAACELPEPLKWRYRIPLGAPQESVP